MKITKEQIEALTQKDVDQAKINIIEARKTRSGVSTLDFILSTVDGTTGKTIEDAKKHLHLVRVAR